MAKGICEGVMVLSTTPLTKDYKLNEDSMRKWIEYCAAQGVDGIFLDGSLAETTTLDEDVRMKEHEVAFAASKGKLFMGAGCYGHNPFQTIRLANHAEKLGYDMAWFFTPRAAPNDEIYGFYKMVHDNTRIPMGIYNAGSEAGGGMPYMSPGLIAKIASLDRMLAMKLVKTDTRYVYELYQLGLYKRLKIIPSRTIVLQLMLGACGVLPSLPRIKRLMEIYKKFNAGDIAGAMKLEASEPNEPGQVPTGAPTAKQRMQGKEVDGVIAGIDMGPYMAPGKAAPTEAEKKAIQEYFKPWEI